ncbi:TrkH family potassium uptake protein [Desulfopila inferna]|uniref:TrkH family potassium uptake protein n=1 Tax=Desulfopila inferna TaxID=468528 RepID=UPI001963B0D8|nr:TrkH family potassium uptake protein [Desulfopila inferna]MBM9606413.1 TrkH family potassium uptake protein [Desulfopila inferna]
MSQQISALTYSIRFNTVGKYLGELFLALAMLTAVPLAVSLISGEHAISLRYMIVLAALSGVGLLLSQLRPSRRIQTNEAMVIAALVFLFIPLLMTYPLMSAELDFLDAFFEAVSAGTTTGLSTIANIEGKTYPFLFSRAWMQWYGGLGIIILVLAILIKPGLAAKNLAVGGEHQEDDIAGNTKVNARWIIYVYASLTSAGIAVLWLLGGDFSESILYTLSAVSTGGFSPHNTSLKGFDGRHLQWIVVLLCFASALPPALYHKAIYKNRRIFHDDPQLRALLVLCLIFTVVLAALMLTEGQDWSLAFYHAPLLAISAQTTAGFSTVDVAGLDAASKGALICSMAIGGGIGSTAGGIKLLRLLILMRVLQVVIIKTCLPPHAILNPRLGRRRLEDEEIKDALCIILLFLVIVFISWLPFLTMGYDPLDSLFEVVSAMGTVGLSTGVTTANLEWFLKMILCFDMLLGRLEMVVWIVLFYPKTWIGKRAEA